MRVATKIDRNLYLIEEDGRRIGTASSPAEAHTNKNVEAIAKTVKMGRLASILRDTVCCRCGEEMIPLYEEVRKMDFDTTDIYVALDKEGETDDLICPDCMKN